MFSLPLADKWRVVLKGDNPDYINATNIHVNQAHTFSTLYYTDYLYLCRATSSTEHLSSLKVPCVPPAETSGRWCVAGSVV